MSARRPCATCGKGRAERFFVSPRGRVCADCRKKTRRATAHAAHVTRTYSLSPAQYAALLEHQRGACSICCGTRSYALHVDHDHATGKVRGLLCRRCNKLLASVRDDAEILAAAVRYLEWTPMQSLAWVGGVPA